MAPRTRLLPVLDLPSSTRVRAGRLLSGDEIREFCSSIDVSTRWYQMVLSGKIPEPSVVKIQRLHDYLAARSKRLTPSKGEAA